MVDGGRWSEGGRKPTIQSFRDLEVFQRSMALLRPIHDIVKDFTPFEQADLAQQMRRASKSIPANIAEGFSRRVTARDFKLYLAHALGSANEMIVHLMIAEELVYSDADRLRTLTSEYEVVARQLARLIQVWRDPPEHDSRSRSIKPRLIRSNHLQPEPTSKE